MVRGRKVSAYKTSARSRNHLPADFEPVAIILWNKYNQNLSRFISIVWIRQQQWLLPARWDQSTTMESINSLEINQHRFPFYTFFPSSHLRDDDWFSVDWPTRKDWPIASQIGLIIQTLLNSYQCSQWYQLYKHLQSILDTNSNHAPIPARLYQLWL